MIASLGNIFQKNKKALFYFVITVIFIVVIGQGVYYRYKTRKISEIMEAFGDCPKSEGSASDMPDYAAEACKKISSKAEEIEAHYGGSAKLLQNMPLYSLFNPNNYKSGDNTTTDMARNIINTNISECEMQSISNSCSNSISSSQINELDQSACYICTHVNPQLCAIKDVVQRNSSDLTSTCSMKAAISILTSKKNSVDAQALAKVLQKADGLLSGANSTRTENCNIIDTNISAATYIDQKNTCINSLDLSQSNVLKACYVSGAIQENHSNQLAECMLNSDTEKVSELESGTKVSKSLEAKQESIGIDTAASAISASASLVSSSLALAGFYFFSQQEI
jgi:hypothetical protein